MTYVQMWRMSDEFPALGWEMDIPMLRGLGFTTDPPPYNVTVVDPVVDTVVDSVVDTVVDSVVDTVVDSVVDSVVDTVVDSVVDTVVDSVVDTVVDSVAVTESVVFDVLQDLWILSTDKNRYTLELEHRLSTRSLAVTATASSGPTPVIKWTSISLSKVMVEVTAVPDMRFVGKVDVAKV